MKKTVHIISHSHWDREWYLPYERHHMLLVELIDDVLELFETDPEFKSFYLDGQTIILDDYLEVRPEKRDVLQKYIDNGQLKIGPFYILQDAYLTSSESNVRNALIGKQETDKWGATTDIGYFPDTFGNPGQIPQLMNQLGFEVAAYGRGVKPTGFANQSSEGDNFVSSYSEMNWKGVDDSEIIGLLFANWYSNGNEIPSEKEAAKVFWDQKLKDVETYASTSHLLMMNGCDHQPVQKDLTQAIRVANDLYPDYEFIHSDFTTYMTNMMEDLPEKLDTVTGELTSQVTEGWYTLTNTASSRVYLKQENAKVSRLLESIAEPLATMAYEVTGKYPHDILDYAWKVYMQNHPHDSICGCSVDEVHEEMMTRFQKAENVAKYVIDEATVTLAEAINTQEHAPEGSIPFVVFNTSATEKTDKVSLTLETDKIYFSEKFPTEGYKDLHQIKENTQYKVVDEKGQDVLAQVAILNPKFNYELPKDAFRQPYIANNVSVSVYVENLAPLSWTTYYLVPTTEKNVVENSETATLENDYLSVEVDQDGTLNVTDKVNNKEYKQLMIFENTGDIGNEYVYKKPNGEEPILSIGKLVDKQVLEETSFEKQLLLTHELDIPVSANELLDLEQNQVVEFRNRKAQRVKETKPLRIETVLTLGKQSKSLSFTTRFTNEMKDHRLRVLFPTGLQSSVHYADTIYETVERPNQVSESWTNPENNQRTHHFIQVKDESNGLVIAPDGLNEYEVIEENNQLTLAVTLLRATGELGDWGYFPTPGAQCLNRNFEFTYHLSFHGKEDGLEAIREAKYKTIPLTAVQTSLHEGELNSSDRYLTFEGEAVALTALKRHRESNDLITRVYNLTGEETTYSLTAENQEAYKTTILEEESLVKDDFTAKPFEIITQRWKKGK